MNKLLRFSLLFILIATRSACSLYWLQRIQSEENFVDVNS